jgi:hypothetical protein
MLIVYSIYQVVSCFISSILFLYALFSVPRQNLNPLIYFFSILILALVAYVIYINIVYVLKRETTKRFIVINRYMNFFQLFHLSVFGFVFYLIIGPDITPAIFYSDKMQWQIQKHFFDIRFNLSYHGGDDNINAGINIVPLLCLIVLHYFARPSNNRQ